VRVHRGGKIVDGLIRERPDFDDAGIVDENVDRAEARFGRADQRVARRTVAHVAREREHRCAEARERFLRGIDRMLRAAAQGHVRTGFEQQPGNDETQTTRTTRDDGRLAGKKRRIGMLRGRASARRQGRSQRRCAECQFRGARNEAMASGYHIGLILIRWAKFIRARGFVSGCGYGVGARRAAGCSRRVEDGKDGQRALVRGGYRA
jgi:hypothetical protein